MIRILISLMCLVVMSTSAQQTIDSITLKFDYYRSHSLQEKVYTHLDRTSYFTGEYLWFKIYYVDGTFHKPLDVSKVAYVEVLDKKNKVVIQTKVELKNGKGGGSLYIPAVLSSDNYIFRVYTHWMKNFSPEYYFYQPITIVNPFIKTDQLLLSTRVQPAYDAQFFPEGGYAVAGQKSKIGFRVINAAGEGINFKGVLLSSERDTVTTFQPLRSGIGHFWFTPMPDEKYTVIIVDDGANKSQFAFPEIRKVGYTMSVKDVGDYIGIDVFSQGITSSLVSLFAHSNNVIIKAESKLLAGGKAQFVIGKTELREGITHFTVFDNESNPVCERLFFKRPEKRLELNVQSMQRSFAKRDLVTLKLQADMDADVSVSIYRRDSISSVTRQNIFSYLWLTSDLRGTVEEPDYYFRYTDSVSTMALDNLMLTHGWRRFTWNEVLYDSPTLKYIPEHKGHIIHGSVTSSEGVRISGANSFLSSPDKIIQLYTSRSDKSGGVHYEARNFFGEKRIITQAGDSANIVKIENPFSAVYAGVILPDFRLSPLLSKSVIDRSVALQVQNVYSYERLNDFRKTLTDSIPFYGRADEEYVLDDYTRFPSLEEVFREYVSGVQVRKRGGMFRFSVVNKITNGAMKEGPLLLLDGVPVFDNNKLLQLSALKVKKIEVVSSEYHYGSLVFPGMIMLTTYNNDMSGFETKSMAIPYEGLQSKREFYSPRYDSKEMRDTRMPDQRTLLHWSEAQSIGPSGSDILFYTSDCSGEYEVIVEGISKEGTAGNSVYYFSVKDTGL